MRISINICGIRLIKEGYFLTGLSLAILSHHHSYSISIVKALTIYMEFGIAAKDNQLFSYKLD